MIRMPNGIILRTSIRPILPIPITPKCARIKAPHSHWPLPAAAQACPCMCRSSGDTAREAQDQARRVIRHFAQTIRWCICHDDPASRRRSRVNSIYTDSIADDQGAARESSQHVRGHRQRRNQDHLTITEMMLGAADDSFGATRSGHGPLGSIALGSVVRIGNDNGGHSSLKNQAMRGMEKRLRPCRYNRRLCPLVSAAVRHFFNIRRAAYGSPTMYHVPIGYRHALQPRVRIFPSARKWWSDATRLADNAAWRTKRRPPITRPTVNPGTISCLVGRALD